MFRNYLKLTFRNIFKNKTHSFLNIIGLAVGIASSVLIFLWVEDELSFDHHHKKFKSIYRILTNVPYQGQIGTSNTHSFLLAKTIKDEIPEVKEACRVTWEEKKLFSSSDKAIYETGYYADYSFFSIFQWPVKYGNIEKTFNQPNSVIITEKMAKKFFNDPNPLGKTLKINNEQDYIITAILKDIPDNSSFDFSWIVPFSVWEKKHPEMNSWGSWGFGQTYVELNENVNENVVNKKLKNIFINLNKESHPEELFLFSMKDWRLRTEFKDGKQTGGGLIIFVNLLTLVAIILVLIACINFMNLSTARSEERAKEIGVRKVLGASRTLLIVQFISEAIILSFIALALALIIVHFSLPFFNDIVGKKLSLHINNSLHVFALFILAILCGLLAGLYPAFYLSSFNPITVLKGLKVKRSNYAGLIRRALVVFQFIAAVILIICTIVIYLQIQHVKNRDTGYDKENLLYIPLRGQLKDRFDIVRREIMSSKDVKDVAMSQNTLKAMYSNSDLGNFNWSGKTITQNVLITLEAITPQYLSTIGLQLKSGRNFYENSAADSLSIIINEDFAKLMGKENPLNEMISMGSERQYRIIGVVKNFLYNSFYGKSEPLIFYNSPNECSFLVIKFESNIQLTTAVSNIEQILKKYNPGYPFEYRFFDDYCNASFYFETLAGKLGAVFTCLSIFITCLGVFGLAAYTAECRTKEIGIRKILGASTKQIVMLLSKDFLKLIVIALIIAIPIAWWLAHELVQKFPSYRITISWPIFAIVSVCILLITLATISFQTLRAAIANPVNNLRSE